MSRESLPLISKLAYQVKKCSQGTELKIVPLSINVLNTLPLIDISEIDIGKATIRSSYEGVAKDLAEQES